MSQKRQINGTKHNIPELVDQAIDAAEIGSLDLEKVKSSLRFMGHGNPSDELIQRYAQETAILKTLEKLTGANFSNQIGKIDFSSRETVIADIDAYLSRRVAGQHAKWSENHKR